MELPLNGVFANTPPTHWNWDAAIFFRARRRRFAAAIVSNFSLYNRSITLALSIESMAAKIGVTCWVLCLGIVNAQSPGLAFILLNSNYEY